jgi:hypothetical protein
VVLREWHHKHRYYDDDDDDDTVTMFAVRRRRVLIYSLACGGLLVLAAALVGLTLALTNRGSSSSEDASSSSLRGSTADTEPYTPLHQDEISILMKPYDIVTHHLVFVGGKTNCADLQPGAVTVLLCGDTQALSYDGTEEDTSDAVIAVRDLYGMGKCRQIAPNAVTCESEAQPVRSDYVYSHGGILFTCARMGAVNDESNRNKVTAAAYM